jgi:phosphate transport system substrate-binding protein
MGKSLATCAVIFFLSLSVAALTLAQTQDGKTVIRVKCPDSMVARTYSLSKMFMKTHPKMTIDFWKGSSLDGGIPALLQGSTDIAMSTRRMTDHEIQTAVGQGKEFVERLIGHGGIVILTNRSNPLNSMTVEQVQKILKGDYTRWNELRGNNEPVTVFSVGPKHPGTLIFVQQDFLGGSPITPNAVIVEDFPTVMKKVSETPGGIGYVRIRDAFESSIAGEIPTKILEIKQSAATVAVAPSRAHVGDGSYPLRRPYFLYFESKAGPAIREYADFIVGKGWGPQDL